VSEWSTVNSVEARAKRHVPGTKYKVPRYFLSRIHVLLRIPTSYLVLSTLYFVPSTLEIGFNRKPKLLDK
jgi:hypothetical protein